MKTILCAGAVALAMFGLLPASSICNANDLSTANFESPQAASIDIGRIRSVLKLTSDQEHYWPPVEAALRDIAHQQTSTEPAGLMRRISRRVVSIVLNSAAVERLAHAARPLIAALDDEQKRAAGGLAREMGLGPVVIAALR
jgi:hypothetical protein